MGKVNRPSGVAAFEDLFSHALDYVLLHHSVVNHHRRSFLCVRHEVEGDAFLVKFCLPLDKFLGPFGHVVANIQDDNGAHLPRVFTRCLDIDVGIVLSGIADEHKFGLRVGSKHPRQGESLVLLAGSHHVSLLGYPGTQ